MILIFLLLFFIVIPNNNHAFIKHLPPNDNVLGVLHNSSLKINLPQSNLVTDISYLSADLKFDGSSLKVCEIGQAIYCGIGKTCVIFNDKLEYLNTPYWGLLWHVIGALDLPFWCIDKKLHIEHDQLLAQGGHYVSSLKGLRKSQFFNQHIKSTTDSNAPLKSYKGIIVFRGKNNNTDYQAFKKEFSDFLHVNNYTQKYVHRKDHLMPLFQMPELKKFKPECRLYQKKYSTDLAQNIINDLGSPFFIIKPVNSMQSRGVNMVSAQDLDSTLRMLLVDKHLLTTKKHRCFSYWLKDDNTQFIVEEYVPSKTILVNGKTYDPTMRLVFFLSHEAGIMTVNVLGGFWKIPIKALNEPGSLTEQHITIPYSGPQYIGIPISPDDMNIVKAMLVEMLTILYPMMLQV